MTQYAVRSTQYEHGIALILAMFTLLFVAMLVIALMNVGGIDQQIATNHIYDVRATYLADAGIETAVYNLRQNSSWSGTGGNVTFPSGSTSYYNVTVSGGTITSSGTVGGYTREIGADYTLSGASAPYTVRLDTWVEQ
ncbi:MAG: hypothetical protein HYY14_01930 [Candidatus Omnitrophica bacterium]|nr:hypothetical protein [Candidatus Omnitrophota bacterium]